MATILNLDEVMNSIQRHVDDRMTNGMDQYLAEVTADLGQDLADHYVDESWKEGTGHDLASTVAYANTETDGEVTADAHALAVEFGTGVVGSQSPMLSSQEGFNNASWVYDINGHGDKGWHYPPDYRWTTGIVSHGVAHKTADDYKNKGQRDIAERVFR